MKFLIISIILPIIVSGIYVDPKCRYGENYWCSSLKNAKNCHAVNHCKTTIWKNQILETDNAEVCQFCKAIVVDVSKYLKQNQSKAFISTFLESACDLVPNVNMVTECKKLVDEYLPEILDIIALDLDEQAICSLLGLCSKGFSFDDSIIHPSQDLSTSNFNGTLCQDCIQFNSDLKEMLFGKQAQAKLIDLLDAYVCRWQGPLKDDCEHFVQKELPKILQKISDTYEPKKCCRMFCSDDQSVESKQMAAIFNIYQQLNLKANTDKCTACMIILGELQNLDQNKPLQKLIEDNVKSLVCPYLKNYNNECMNIVDMYLPIVFQFLASELDPSARCRNLEFCPSQASNEIPMIDLVPATTAADHRHMKNDVAVRGKASPVCVMCEFVMVKLQKLIGDNRTEANIISALEKVCAIMPATVRDECVSFVDLYGKAILDLLMQDLSAELICKALGLCFLNDNRLVFKPHLESTCEVCQMTMQYLESLLDQKATLDEIKALLDKICKFLPDSEQQQCEQMINDYEALIIDFLIKKLPPKVICQELKLCDSLGGDVNLVKETTTSVIPKSHEKLYFKCISGPSYWCASQENAKLCQAEEHCKKFVW